MKVWGYNATYQMDKLKFFAQVMQVGPEKFVFGVHGRHGKRLDTYAEFKIDNTDRSETTLGFKTRFATGELRGNVTSSMKIESIYRRFI